MPFRRVEGVHLRIAVHRQQAGNISSRRSSEPDRRRFDELDILHAGEIRRRPARPGPPWPTCVGLDQEAVVAVVGVDGDQRPGRRCGGDQLALRRAGTAGRSRRPRPSARAVIRCERSVDAAAAAADVVRVHRLGEHHVGVRVEPPAQLVAVVVQVGLHRVPAAAQRVLVALAGSRPNRCPVRARDGRSVCAICRATAIPASGGARVVVVAAAEVRVGPDRRELR